MEERCLGEVGGIFKMCFAVAISPTSSYKQRNWLYSADQDGDGKWREGLAERAPKQEWGGEEGRVNSKRTLEFHSKN